MRDTAEGSPKGLTTRHYVGMVKVSRATAYREISDFVEKGLLEYHRGQGHNVRYTLNPSFLKYGNDFFPPFHTLFHLKKECRMLYWV